MQLETSYHTLIQRPAETLPYNNTTSRDHFLLGNTLFWQHVTGAGANPTPPRRTRRNSKSGGSYEEESVCYF